MSAPWRLAHLDLSGGLAEVPRGERDVWLILWWRDLPLGQLEIAREQLPMRIPELSNRLAQVVTPAVGARLFNSGFRPSRPTNLRVLPASDDAVEFDRVVVTTHPLDSLFSTSLRSDREDVRRLKISVVVCTRDRAEPLRRCLRSLQKLSPPADEIVVVDNAPCTGATKDVAAEFPNVRYVREPRGGLDIARNAGVQNSTSEIVAFADDDVETHFAWLAKLRSAFSDAGVMAVTGLVLPAELETEAQALFETRWGFNRGYRAMVFDGAWFERELRCGVPADQIGAGANMAFRREIFARIGGFDERLDVGAAGCSGDSEFWYRVLAAGWKCRYEPAAVVFHHHRREDEALQRQLFFYMRGHAAALLVQFANHGHFGNLRRLFFTLPRHYLVQFLRSLLRPELRRALWPQVAGHFSGIKFYFENR